jgi:hypothetical protein
VIVAVSDHGETVDQLGGGHGLAFTSDELRVPFIVWAPRLVKPSEERAVSANHLDFAPTMASLFGVSPSADWLGRNLLADSVESRMLYLGLGVGLYVGLFDHGVAAMRSERDQSLHLFDAKGDAFRELSPGTMDPARVNDYERATRTLDDKTKLAHLERATAGR